MPIWKRDVFEVQVPDIQLVAQGQFSTWNHNHKPLTLEWLINTGTTASPALQTYFIL